MKMRTSTQKNSLPVLSSGNALMLILSECGYQKSQVQWMMGCNWRCSRGTYVTISDCMIEVPCWGLYLPPWVLAESGGFRVECRNSMEFHGILMESRWLKPQPFWFPIPLKFQWNPTWNPTESDRIWWKQLESGSLREQFPLESIGIPTRFHGIPMESIFQLNSNGIWRNPLEYGYSSEIPTNSDRFQ